MTPRVSIPTQIASLRLAARDVLANRVRRASENEMMAGHFECTIDVLLFVQKHSAEIKEFLKFKESRDEHSSKN